MRVMNLVRLRHIGDLELAREPLYLKHSQNHTWSWSANSSCNYCMHRQKLTGVILATGFFVTYKTSRTVYFTFMLFRDIRLRGEIAKGGRSEV